MRHFQKRITIVDGQISNTEELLQCNQSKVMNHLNL
ncbi:hypothetical protein RCF54_09020, partial [Staphylococcus aureus]|nr:hypothetical protein [Staphylococcus aureus]